jgi:predicted nucleotide-binding protein
MREGVDKSRPLLFPAYAFKDHDVVHPIIQAVQEQGIEVWEAFEALKPGEEWSATIKRSVDQATGILVFISTFSSESGWVQAEIKAFCNAGRLVIPVLLDEAARTPALQMHIPSDLQWVDLSGRRGPEEIRRAAQRIASTATRASDDRLHESPSSHEELDDLAEKLLAGYRHQGSMTPKAATPPRSVFVVHGHDELFLSEVEEFFKQLGVESVVLRRIGGPAQSLFQKFMQWGRDTRFALVLLTADDFGASRIQFEAEGVGARALQFRARQNVILELGFFYGHLGWENVFVLYKPPDDVFPNFERPSDIEGVIFDHVDQQGRWREFLRGKLLEAGFEIA